MVSLVGLSQDIGEHGGWKYMFGCWFDILELGEEVADDDCEEGDEDGIKRRWGFVVPSTIISADEDDEIGGMAVQPLIELCPEEVPELPLLVNGGKGTVPLPCSCNWFIVGNVVFMVGGAIEVEVPAEAETLDPAILMMWGAWFSPYDPLPPFCGDLEPAFAARRIILLASSVCMSTAWSVTQKCKEKQGKLKKMN